MRSRSSRAGQLNGHAAHALRQEVEWARAFCVPFDWLYSFRRHVTSAFHRSFLAVHRWLTPAAGRVDDAATTPYARGLLFYLPRTRYVRAGPLLPRIRCGWRQSMDDMSEGKKKSGK